MKTLAEVKKYVDSFPRPLGYNTYAWNVTKRTAMEVWRCYLENRAYYRPVNFLCSEFYEMVKKEDGSSLVPFKASA